MTEHVPEPAAGHPGGPAGPGGPSGPNAGRTVVDSAPTAGARTVADEMITMAEVHDPSVTVGALRALFAGDDHMRAAVIVADGLLICVVEPDDLAAARRAVGSAVPGSTVPTDGAPADDQPADGVPTDCAPADDEPAMRYGALGERVVAPDAPVEPIRLRMLATGRRRLAVTDADGRYRGLLCLKRTGRGFCSHENVRSRQAETRPTDR
ncbi:MAG: hypothetical protein FWD74_00930 [Actinomycetia bacterium]|nr:hypothetical protein [Actinomycetes bacterium]